MPVRRVGSHDSNIIGLFPSLKADAPVAFESTIERDLLFFLEFDPTVLRYSAQPFTITDNSDGTTHRYTPDYDVQRNLERVIIECKPAARVNDAHTQQQCRIGQRWAVENNAIFILVTDIDLRTGVRLTNLKLLWRYCRLFVSQPVIAQCRDYLIQHATATFVDLASYLAGEQGSLRFAPTLYHLLFRHILVTDLDQLLNPQSVIRWATQTGE